MTEDNQDTKTVSNTISQENNNTPTESTTKEKSVRSRLYTEEISFDDFIEQKRRSKKVST